MTIVECFDERGNEITEGNMLQTFFMPNGNISKAHAKLIRSRMMEKMPLAHTDLARMFYAIEAQEKCGVAAKVFYK